MIIVILLIALSTKSVPARFNDQIVTMGGAMSWIKKIVGMAEEEDYFFPDNLEEFGYYFTEDGKLRSIEGNQPFEFNVRDEFQYNQKHYNALGDIITEKIYEMMVKDHQLQKKHLPADAEEEEPTSFLFISDDFYTNKDKLLVLIHGSGAVRAGQWARRLIINDCLDSGTQLPYIKWGREQGYSIVVANTNYNTVESPAHNKRPVKIRGNGSPEEHTESLWKELVQQSPARHIAIVAHSYGGVCTLELAKNHLREFQERVFAVALTDSVHGLRQQEADSDVMEFYKQQVINWASAYDPLDTPLLSNDCPTVSAGTDKHEYTSYSSMNSIFKYFNQKYSEKVNPSGRPLSLTEPLSFTSPVSSESQNLVTRETGEGQEDAVTIATQQTLITVEADLVQQKSPIVEAREETEDGGKESDKATTSSVTAADDNDEEPLDLKTEVKSEL